MNVAIIGFGVEGRAALTYWQRQGATVTICDQDAAMQVPAGIATQLGLSYLHGLDRFDVVMRSAGIHPDIILAANPTIGDKLTSTINEFMRVSPTKHIIGVTGTKGKGTTSTLIARMLAAAGEEVFLGGNIGVSPLDFLPRLTQRSWVVLELSSYQLADLKRSPNIAVCLMVVPEHLNWHNDMDKYVEAKSQLFAHQTRADTAIYYANNEISRTIASHSRGLKIPYYAEPGARITASTITIAGAPIVRLGELKLIGQHNWQNVCAALTAVWQVTQNVAAFRSVLTTFQGLEHRLEPVRILDDVQYYNDSYASTPDAAIAAVEAITKPKVMIVGGFDRNLPIQHLAKSIAAHTRDIRKLVVIGASAQRLVTELEAAGFTNYVIEPSPSMSVIVQIAKGFAKPGDAVVLSPGFASFDMFKNFEDRGLQFKEAVQRL